MDGAIAEAGQHRRQIMARGARRASQLGRRHRTDPGAPACARPPPTPRPCRRAGRAARARDSRSRDRLPRKSRHRAARRRRRAISARRALPLQRPEQRRASSPRALQHAVEINGFGAEPHAEPRELSGGPRRPAPRVAPRHRRRATRRALRKAERRGRAPRREFGVARAQQRRKAPALFIAPRKNRPGAGARFAQRRLEEIAGEYLDPRLERAFAGIEPPDRAAAPEQRAIGARANSSSGAAASSRTRAAISPRSTRWAAASKVLASPPSAHGIGHEAEAVEPADRLALDLDLAGAADRGQQLARRGEPLHQESRAAIDEALGDAVVQRVGEPVLDGARALLPLRGVGEPVRRDARYRSRCGYARCASSACRYRRRRGRAGSTWPATQSTGSRSVRPAQMAIDLPEEARMGVAHHLAEVGDLADLPEQPHRVAGWRPAPRSRRCAPARASAR